MLVSVSITTETQKTELIANEKFCWAPSSI